MNLFAISENDVWRLPLTAPVQAEIGAMFKNQEEFFDASYPVCIPFDGKYKPDDFECLSIANFSGAARMYAALNSPLEIQEIPASAEVLVRIKALFTGYEHEGDMRIPVQRFDQRQVLSSRGLSIFHSSDVFKKIEGPGITLDSRLCALIKNGELRFRSFHVMRQVFDNVAQYYVEATDADIDLFAASSCLSVNSIELKNVADTWVRRKITLVSASDILARVPVPLLVTIARDFGINLLTEQNGSEQRLIVPTQRSELLGFLRFLDEDYYKSPVSEARYLTNSKRRLVD